MAHKSYVMKQVRLCIHGKLALFGRKKFHNVVEMLKFQADDIPFITRLCL